MKYTLKRVKINWTESPVSQVIAKAKQTKKELETKGFKHIKTNYRYSEAEMLYRK